MTTVNITKQRPDWPNPHGVWANTIKVELEVYKREIEDEIGEFEIWYREDTGEEVVLENHQGTFFRAYMSDHHADARLVIDDPLEEEYKHA